MTTSAAATTNAELPREVCRTLPWLVAVALFMENLDATIVNVAVPTMAASLGVEPLSLKAVLTTYTLSLAIFIPASGWMADRFGTRRVFEVAIGLFLAGSLGCGLAPNVPLLVASRLLQGIGGAMMTPVGRVALVRSFPRSELLRTMNYVVIPALLGPLLGPVTGGFIVHVASWRAIFFVNVPLALFGLWLTRRYMPDYRDPAVPRLDRWGFVLFCSGIALLSHVLEVFGEHHHASLPVVAMTIAALALLAAYGWHARRKEAPLLELGLFRVRTYRLSVLGGFVTRLGFGGMPFLLPLLYQLGLGFPPWQAGLLTMPTALAAMGMKLVSRRVLKRFGHRTTLLANTVLLGLTMALFTQIDRGTPVLAILALSFTQGFFSSLQFTAMNSLVYADVDDRDASKAGSIASTAQQLSLSFGVAVGSLVTAWFLGSVGQTDAAQAIPALHHAFLTLGLVTIASAATFFGLRPHDGNNVSGREPQPPPRGQARAESRAAIGVPERGPLGAGGTAEAGH
ncbi:MAG: DHA2 family efflux MFS transporter permease subunit [Opitutaceae bacterium]